MRRKEGTARGAGEWEQLSWEQAITEITDKWKQLQADFGPEAVAFMSGSGSGMATISYTGRLQALMGAMTIAPCYDNSGMFCQWNHCGFHPYTNGHNEYRDIANAETIFVWGTNPSESNITDYHFISEAREKGAKMVCIDPIYTTTASKADKYISIRPATDGLLCAGMAQIGIRDGKMDKAHIQTMTVGPFLVKDSDGLYLRLSDLGQAEAGSAEDRILVMDGGQAVAFDAATNPEIEGSFEVEGIAVKPACQILLDRINEWDLETIASYTDIPVETIEELSALYTEGLTMIITGYGPDHYANAQTAYDGFHLLMDLFGKECKHGAGMSCTDFNAPTAQGLVNVATTDLAGVAAAGKTIYAPHFHELMRNGSYGDVTQAPKSAYIYICNPITNEPDRLQWLESFGSMEMVVVADMFMSETARYADYVLPVAFLFERDDLATTMNPFVKYTQKAVDPICDAKGDFELITELGRAMGFEDYFTMDLPTFLEACVTNDTAAAMGVTWEALQEQNAIWAFPEDPVVIGLTTPPYTATGRMEFYHEGIQPQHNVGQAWDMKKESCWFWEPPLEAWYENELFAKYPITLISERSKFKTHTMFNNAPMILELDPEPYVKMSPADAEAYGVAEGDVVKLYNDRGFVVIRVAINAGCRPGVMVVDHGWEEGSYIDGHYSDLSSCFSWPRFEQDNWFDCLVQMEKVQ